MGGEGRKERVKNEMVLVFREERRRKREYTLFIYKICSVYVFLLAVSRLVLVS